MGLKALQHHRLDRLHPRLKRGLGRYQIPEQFALPIGKREGQGAAKGRELAAHMVRKPAQDHLPGIAGDQAVQHDPAIDAEHVADDAADPHSGAVDHLLHPVANPRALLDQAAPMAAERAQRKEGSIRHQARTAQSELAYPRQPAAVLDIRLATA